MAKSNPENSMLSENLRLFEIVMGLYNIGRGNTSKNRADVVNDDHQAEEFLNQYMQPKVVKHKIFYYYLM